MRQAPVGWQCAKCVHRDSRQSPVTRWRPGTMGRLGNTRMTPVVIALIAINIVVYLWEQASGTVVVAAGFRAVAWNRAQFNYGMWPYMVHHGQWYRLLTAPWLHANFEHILFNMVTLAIVGPPVEAELGRTRFLGLYLVSALGGSVGSYLLSNANAIGVGASGAIFGVMGAYFVLARRRGWDLSMIGGLIVVNLIIGFTSSTIDWRAHLGGLVSGGLVAAGLAYAMDLRRRASQLVEVAAGAGTVLGVAAVLAALTILPPGHVNL
jgi:membrane associated rhomboid family serine protease